MKAGRASIFLMAVLCLQTSLGVATAQTPAGVANKQAGIHKLTESQERAIKRINSDAERRAAPAALKLAGIVRKIYENMLAEKPDEALRARLDLEMKDVTWRLFTLKGQAIRETVNVLTPKQKQLVIGEMRAPGASADLSEVIAHTFNLAAR